MAVADFGFVGVGPQRVVVSSDGVSWVEHRVDVNFHDVAAAWSTVVATAQDGIYTWTAPPESLPDTGTNTTPAVIIGVALLATGAAVLAKRRSLADST